MASENETEIRKDCIGSGCVNLKPCAYCEGSAAPKYTQAEMDTRLQRQREWFVYWLLRAYQSGHREGWEDTPSVQVTMDDLHNVLCNEGYDPAKPQAVELLKQKFAYFLDIGASSHA